MLKAEIQKLKVKCPGVESVIGDTLEQLKLLESEQCAEITALHADRHQAGETLAQEMRDKLKWSEGVVRLAARRKVRDLVGLKQRFEYLGQTLFMLTEANKDASNQSIKFHSELKWHYVATKERVTQRQVSVPWEQMSISELL